MLPRQAANEPCAYPGTALPRVGRLLGGAQRVGDYSLRLSSAVDALHSPVRDTTATSGGAVSPRDANRPPANYTVPELVTLSNDEAEENYAAHNHIQPFKRIEAAGEIKPGIHTTTDNGHR